MTAIPMQELQSSKIFANSSPYCVRVSLVRVIPNAGIAMDYVNDKQTYMTAKEFAVAKKEMYYKDDCLTDEITREELIKAREHAKKKYEIVIEKN
jgi:hypothetical protein